MCCVSQTVLQVVLCCVVLCCVVFSEGSQQCLSISAVCTQLQLRVYPYNGHMLLWNCPYLPLITEAQTVPQALFPSKSQDYVRCSKQ
jgi:hypothetical protein